MIDFLRELLFESVPMLVTAEVVALVLAIAVHRRRLTPGSRRGLWITLTVCVLLLILQKVVVTDREAIEQTVQALKQAVKEGDAAAFGSHVDQSFRAGRSDKAALMAKFNERFTEWQVEAPSANILSIEVHGDSAVVRFRVFCDLKSQRESQDHVMTYWRIRCVRDGNEWKMQSVEVAEYGPGIFTKQGGLDLMPYLGFKD